MIYVENETDNDDLEVSVGKGKFKLTLYIKGKKKDIALIILGYSLGALSVFGLVNFIP